MDLKQLRKPKLVLLALALALAAAGAALGRDRALAGATESAAAPATLEPFAVARLLSEAPPDTVVIVLGDPGRHPLTGASPITLFGPGEDEQVEGAPRARRIVLVGADAVRTDRVARRLLATGRDVAVLAGGLEAWDRAMDTDPPAPPPTAGALAREAYLKNVALRRAFGDRSMAPPPAPVAPTIVPGAAPPPRAKKREGC